MPPLRQTMRVLALACGTSVAALVAGSAMAAPDRAAADGVARSTTRPRVIVTTDGEQDDLASMHRFILYTDDLDVAGIVETSSRFHHSGDAAAVPPIPQVTWLGSDWIHSILRNYAAAYSKLKANSPGFPTPEYLASMVKVGNISDVGEYAKNTEGSEWIKKILLDDDPRPVYISVWGGTNVVAAALRSIRDEYYGKPEWPQIYSRASHKAWILIDLDQDATYRDYIAKVWPDVNVVMNNEQYRAFAYRWEALTPEPLKAYYEAKFQDTMIRKGPIQADYSLANDTRGKPHDWFSEGDTPQYMQQFTVGLSDLDDYDPSFGNWGGRYARKGPHLWVDNPSYLDLPGAKLADYSPYAGAGDFPSTTLAQPAERGSTTIRLASVSELSARDIVTISSGARAQQREILQVGTAAARPTTLTAPAAAGETNIKVSNTVGVSIGDPLSIRAGGEQETRTVTGVGSASLDTVLSAALPVGATAAHLAATTGLTVGDTLTIGRGAGAQAVKLTAVGAVSSEYVVARAKTTLAAGFTTLAKDAAAGTRELRLVSVDNFLKGQTVRIEGDGVRETAMLDAVGVGGGTMLGLPSAAGVKTVKILSTANFLADTPVWIGEGAELERAVISPQGPRYPARGADQEGTRAAGASLLVAPSAAGARLVKVANIDGFLVGAPVTVDTGTDAENVHVSYVGSAGMDGSGIELVEPLQRSHAANAPIAASGLTFTSPLVRSHPAGTAVTSSGATLGAVLRAALTGEVRMATVTPAGTRVLKVVSSDGFERGRTIVVDAGGNRETAVIAMVGTGGLGGTGLTLAAPTKLVHVGPVTVEQVTAPAGATRLRLAEAVAARLPEGLPALDLNGRRRTAPPPPAPLPAIATGDRITIGEGAAAEQVTVSSVGTSGLLGTGVAFTPALRRDHDGVVNVSDAGKGVRFAPALRTAYRAGDPVAAAGGGISFGPGLSQAYGPGAIVQGYGSGVVLTAPLDAPVGAGDVFRSNMNAYYPQARWTAAIQNDFAARVDWQLKSYADANHAPIVTVPANRITMRPGQVVELKGSARDPDRNALKYSWWQYREAGTYPGAVTLAHADRPEAQFTVPQDAKPGQTIHMIFEVEDAGKPPMTRYQRVIVAVADAG